MKGIRGRSTHYYFRRLLGDIASGEPRRAVAGIVLMTLASLFEGIVIAMLIPLLSLLGFGGNNTLGWIARRFDETLGLVGLQLDLLTVAALMVGLTGMQQMAYLAQAWIFAGMQVGYMARWQHQLTEALLRCQWVYFTRKNAGELAHVLNLETRRASILISHGAHVAAQCLSMLTYIAVALLASWQVTLALVLGGMLIMIVSQYAVHRPAAISARQTELYAGFASKASEVLATMKLVRASGDGALAVRKMLWPRIEALRQAERKVAMNPAILRACFEFFAMAVLMMALLLALTVLRSDGTTFLLIAAMFVRFYPRATAIQQHVQHFRIAMPYFIAVVDALDEAHAAAELSPWGGGGASSKPLAPPTLRLDDVQVSYGERAALRGCSLEIGSRQTIGIVGPSGSGKSTLADTLLCLVPFQSGRIEVDGRALSEIDLTVWRRSIGYVSQDTFLFNATLAENIAFAQPSATLDQVREAAGRAHLLDFIDRLPDGLDTIVGDRGVMLSGGERQRVGIARALLGDKTLLILDEATAALDSETEAAIMNDISELHGQITIVMIAHRLSTLRDADHIFVLEQGRVVESGSWETLIRRGGAFQRLWSMQSEVPIARAAAR
jgi:ATP-binding cassette, subfamily C, bacterial